MLDTLCLTGEVGWARLSRGSRDATQLVGATPVALFLREHAAAWAVLKDSATSTDGDTGLRPGSPKRDEREDCRLVLGALRSRGASFTGDLATACGLEETAVRSALGDLVAAGLVASDGFGGLRAIVRASGGRPPQTTRHSVAGRWSLLSSAVAGPADTPDARSREAGVRDAAVELQARTLLKRYGIVFRRLLAREANVAPWRELTRVYRRLEARGEIRGGRFVAGMSGEQFALGGAIERLREVRRTPASGTCLVISAADPLNLAGIVTAGERVRAVAATRIAYRDGVPVAAMEGDYVRPLIPLTDVALPVVAEVATTLAGRPVPPVLSGFVGRS
jgi:ATP-dependent Lhr-like helicase